MHAVSSTVNSEAGLNINYWKCNCKGFPVIETRDTNLIDLRLIRQQDSQEFLRFLLERLHEEINQVQKKSWEPLQDIAHLRLAHTSCNLFLVRVNEVLILPLKNTRKNKHVNKMKR